MIKNAIFLAILTTSNLVLAGVHWGYEGQEAPENWGQLATEYQICQTGKNQSPINISHVQHAKLDKIVINYGQIDVNIVNNGHTIQVSENDNSDYIILDDEKYTLNQFHFHAPSENQIEGKTFPVEGHFVHTDKSGNLMVLAIMFEEGATNPTVDKLFSILDDEENHPNNFENLDIISFLPAQKHYYRFSGSLTTPPCSEGVIWNIMAQPMTLSKTQIDQFKKAFKHHNNRPIQPLNGRLIVADE
jgi:carbonic anhydrase